VDDSSEEDDSKDEVFLCEAPIQGIIGILRWLRCQHDMAVLASAMLETGSLLFRMGGILVEQHSARHVCVLLGFKHTETHDGDEQVSWWYGKVEMETQGRCPPARLYLTKAPQHQHLKYFVHNLG
jgi:hypothetical protein